MRRDVEVTGVILAGGRGRRMGGADKSFVTLGGQTLLERVIARAKPQVDQLLISANADIPRFEAFGLVVIQDRVPGFLGPLAGILTALAWSKENHPKAEWLATFPNDSPFFPPDLVSRLIAAARESGTLIASVVSAGRHHPVFAVWSKDVPASPDDILEKSPVRRVDAGIDLFPNVKVDFSSKDFDPFFNVNTPADLAAAERLLARAGGYSASD